MNCHSAVLPFEILNITHVFILITFKPNVLMYYNLKRILPFLRDTEGVYFINSYYSEGSLEILAYKSKPRQGPQNFTVQNTDQLIRTRWGTSWKCSFSSPTLYLLNQNHWGWLLESTFVLSTPTDSYAHKYENYW